MLKYLKLIIMKETIKHKYIKPNISFSTIEFEDVITNSGSCTGGADCEEFGDELLTDNFSNSSDSCPLDYSKQPPLE